MSQPPRADAHPVRRRLLGGLALVSGAALASGCASLGAEPLRVFLVDLKSLPGQGLEWRMQARLRVQNPGSAEVRFEGVSLTLDLRGQAFASGVSPQAGVIPGYGEAEIELPLTISGFSVLRQMFDLVRELAREAGPRSPAPALPYALRGRLGGAGGWGGHGFESSGVVEWPEFGASRPGAPAPK